MKTKTFILASVALFALGVDSATSGPCTTEIDGLAKTLAAKDAGSGPTPSLTRRIDQIEGIQERPAPRRASQRVRLYPI
jgi:hypothetical protein